MPKVPQIGDDRVQLSPTPAVRSNFRAPEADQSAKVVNKFAEKFIDQAAKIEVEEIKKANQVAVTAGDSQFSALENQLMYDKDTGAINQKGRNSFGTLDSVTEAWKKNTNKIIEGAANDAQRAALKANADKRFASMSKSLHGHIAKETQAYDKEVIESYLFNEQEAAINNFHDPERVAHSIQKQKDALIAQGRRFGEPASETKQRILESTSSTQTGVVSRLLDAGGDIEAKEYYKKNMKDFTSKDRSKIEKLLKEGHIMGESNRIVDAIYKKTDDPTSVLEHARKVKDPKLRDEVTKKVKQRFQDEKNALDVERYTAMNEATGIVEESKDFGSVPPSIRAKLSLNQRQALEKRARALKNGLPLDTDLKSYYQLENLASNPQTRSKFLRTNLLNYVDKLSSSDFKKMSGLQRSLREGKTKELDGIQTKSNIVSNALGIAGIDQKDNPQDAADFRAAVDQRVLEVQERTGKKVSNEELRQITNDMTVEVVTGSKFLFFNKKKRFFQLDSGDSAEVLYDDIPRQDKEKIEQALRSNGKPVNEQNVLNIYSQRLNRIRNGRK